MPLIRGDNLTPRQRAEVLAEFPYRWTVENKERARAEWQAVGAKPPEPLMTDGEWLALHTFHFNDDGDKLSRKCKSALMSFDIIHGGREGV